MQNFTFQILRVLKNLLNKFFIMFLHEDCPTGSSYFMYIHFVLGYWRRFMLSIRSLFLSGKYNLQCVILSKLPTI